MREPNAYAPPKSEAAAARRNEQFARQVLVASNIRALAALTFVLAARQAIIAFGVLKFVDGFSPTDEREEGLIESVREFGGANLFAVLVLLVAGVLLFRLNSLGRELGAGGVLVLFVAHLLPNPAAGFVTWTQIEADPRSPFLRTGAGLVLIVAALAYRRFSREKWFLKAVLFTVAAVQAVLMTQVSGVAQIKRGLVVEVALVLMLASWNSSFSRVLGADAKSRAALTGPIPGRALAIQVLVVVLIGTLFLI